VLTGGAVLAIVLFPAIVIGTSTRIVLDSAAAFPIVPYTEGFGKGGAGSHATFPKFRPVRDAIKDGICNRICLAIEKWRIPKIRLMT
jgi:hypothetical protein